MLRADTIEDQANLIGYTPKNILMNGDMKINQRGAQTSGASSQWPADRWRLTEHTSGGVIGTQESDGPHTKDGHFRHYAQINVATADTSLSGTEYGGIDYKVEGFDLHQLGYGTRHARTSTLSFWHCHSVPGIFSVSIRNPGGGSNRNFVFDYQQDEPNVWQKTTRVVPGDVAGTWSTGINAGMSIMFTYVQGASYALADQYLDEWYAGTYYHASNNQTNLMATVGNKFRITGIQLVAGAFAEGLPFQFRTYAEELALCQRYYQRINGGGYSWITEVQRHNSTGFRSVLHLPVPLRAVPSIEYSNLAYWYNNGSLGAGTQSIGMGYTATGSTNIDHLNLEYIPTSMGLTTNGNLSAMLSFTSAGGYIAFSSEM
jgi:hypothetical protein